MPSKVGAVPTARRSAALLELTPPAKEQPFGDLMLAAKLGGSFLAALDLAA